MTDQEILDEVADQISETTLASKILRWTNSYIARLASRYTFDFLRDQKNFSTVISQQSYTLDPSLMFLRKPPWYSVQQIDPIDEELLASNDPRWNTLTGPVTRYILYYQTLLLYKIPTSVFTVYYTFQKQPTPVASGKLTEYTGFPSAWHEALAQGAIVKGFKYRNNPQYGAALLELKDMLRELMPNVNRRPDMIRYMGSDQPRSRQWGLQLPIVKP